MKRMASNFIIGKKAFFEEFLNIHKEKIEKNLSEAVKPDVAQKYRW